MTEMDEKYITEMIHRMDLPLKDLSLKGFITERIYN